MCGVIYVRRPLSQWAESGTINLSASTCTAARDATTTSRQAIKWPQPNTKIIWGRPLMQIIQVSILSHSCFDLAYGTAKRLFRWVYSVIHVLNWRVLLQSDVVFIKVFASRMISENRANRMLLQSVVFVRVSDYSGEYTQWFMCWFGVCNCKAMSFLASRFC